MSKRAIVIFALAFLVGAWALIDGLMAGGGSRASAPVASAADAGGALDAIRMRLLGHHLGPGEIDLVKRIREPWARSPFGRFAAAADGVAVEERAWRGAPRAELTFDGYVAMGGRKVAFLSGVPHEVGDWLTDVEMRLAEVADGRAVLENPDTGETWTLDLDVGLLSIFGAR
jgi:hypothetical protein